MNVNEIYTPLSKAKEEIWRRWNDKELRKKVEEFLGGDLIHKFGDEPKAIYSRGMLTPNYETAYFLDVSDLIGLKPLCFEFYSDLFCSNNKDKVHLGKLVFACEKNNKFLITKKKTLIDFRASENKSFKQVQTLDGKNLIELHHSLYVKKYGELLDSIDISSLKEKQLSIKEIYKKIFAFCIIKGVFFENLITKETEHEKKFVENVMMPAFLEVYNIFGLKPLVVPLLPLKNEEREYWIYYHPSIEEYLI